MLRTGYPGDTLSVNAWYIEGIDVFTPKVGYRFEGRSQMTGHEDDTP